MRVFIVNYQVKLFIVVDISSEPEKGDKRDQNSSIKSEKI